MNLIQAFACSNFLLGGFLTITVRPGVNRLGAIFISIFLFCTGTVLFDDLFYQSDMYKEWPFLIGIVDLWMLAVPPSFYLAVRYFTLPLQKMRWFDLLHFIPFALNFLLSIEVFFTPGSEKLKYIDGSESLVNEDLFYGFMIGFLVYLLIYLILSHRRIITHGKNLKKFTSNVESKDLRWLSNLILACYVLLVFWINEYVAEISILKESSSVIFFLGSVYIIYFSIKQPQVFPKGNDQEEEIAKIFENADKENDWNENLEKERANLIAFLEQEKPYLDNELNLLKLSNALHSSTHQLSKIINVGFGMNFYELINSYRIEESKKLLSDPKFNHLNMIGIAFQSGFNSKTTFNTTFKKLVGVSPLDYKKGKGKIMN